MDIKVQSMLGGRAAILDRPVFPSHVFSRENITAKQNLQPLYGVQMPGTTRIYASTLPTMANVRIQKGAIIAMPQAFNGLTNIPAIGFFDNNG
jgi:hypothetical protein